MAAEGLVVGHNVVKGFLNLELDPAYWSQWLLTDAADPAYGVEPEGSRPYIVVEYSSPNTTKSAPPRTPPQQLPRPPP